MGIKTVEIKYQRDNSKRSEFDLISILLVFFAIGIIVGAILFIFYVKAGKTAQLIEEQKIISAVIFENNGSRTEAIFLSFYNSKTRRLVLIAIPDNTRLKVDYEDRPTYDTVRNLYTKGGIGVARRAIEKLAGTSFEFYIVCDLRDIEMLVDLLEGVQISSPDNLAYSDASSNIFIKLKKGPDMYDGAKVKQLLLYKYGADGFQINMDSRRAFIKSMLGRSKDISGLISTTKVSRRVTRDIVTNLRRKDMKVLARELLKLDESNVFLYRMNGRQTTIKDEVFVTPAEGGKWLRERVVDVQKYVSGQGPEPVKDDISIEILNGSSNPGQAQSLRNYLVEYGFTIAHFGNALRNDYEKTMVIDRAGVPTLARRVAEIINCTDISSKVDPSLMVDVTIIIGNDFEGQSVR